MLWVIDEYDLRTAHATVSHEYDYCSALLAHARFPKGMRAHELRR